MQRKVFGNVFFSIMDKALMFMFSMCISIIVARYLGASEFGRYTYFGVIYTFVSSIASFGMQQIVTKEFAMNANRRKTILCSAIIVGLSVGCLTESVIIIIQVVTDFLSWLEVVVLGIVCFFNVGQVFYYFLTATYRLEYVVKIKKFILGVCVFTYILLIIKQASVECFILAYALKECGILLTSFIAFVISKEYSKIKDQEIGGIEILNTIKRLIRLCFPLLLGGLSVTLYTKIDQVMIKGILDEEQLGIYSIGIKLVDAFFFIPPAFTAGMLPYFSELYRDNRHMFWIKYEKFASVLNVLAYLYIIVIILIGKWAIFFLYGEEYADALEIMLVAIWSVIPVCMGCARGIFLSIMEYSGLIFFFSVVAAVLNICMNYFLIHRFGVLGASIASVISYWVQGFILTFVSPKLKQMARVQCKSLYGFVFMFKDKYLES